jgi:hypothetical protein
MQSIRCHADMTRILDGALDPRLRALLTDRELKPGERIVVVQSRDTLATVRREIGVAIIAHLAKSRAARRAEAHRFVLDVAKHPGGWLEARLVNGVTTFIPDRVDVPAELLIPLLAH